MGMSSSRCAFSIDPLPDFLEDNSLLSQDYRERLCEHATRWVQFIEGLWTWCDRATFAIRFLHDRGTTRCTFIARAFDPREAASLQSGLHTSLIAHRLLRPIGDARIDPFELARITALRQAVHIDLAQYAPRNLWQPPIQANAAVDRSLYPDLTVEDWTAPPVLYGWRGAGGPFLLPMESLAAQRARVALTIYLQPTLITSTEWAWLAQISRVAHSMSDENVTGVGRGAASRRVDPSATLAAQLYASSLRRLSLTPFLVMAQCSAEGDSDAAQAVAAAVQSIPHEPPLFDLPPGEESLPSACVRFGESEQASERLYAELDLRAYGANAGLARLPMLTDATGASTLFRLPVSVRGGVPGLVVRQFPPDFRPGPRLQTVPAGHIELGRFEGGGLATMPTDDLTRHVLVTGFTGSGKTWTVFQIVHQLWVDQNVPFLVLESAKQEYRSLATVPAIAAKQPLVRIYTLGNEGCVPFRINPFELLPGVRVEAHISRLQTCFEAAVPQIGPSTSVITEALYDVYERRGFQLTDVMPARTRPRRRFPTLREFVKRIEEIIASRGYRGEVLSNLQAALVGRFAPLLLGGKGRMFDTQVSSPGPDELFGNPIVLEMNDLNLDDKSLVVMFLLTVLREYRELHPGRGRLAHFTVVEEAHNVLEDVGSEGGGEGATKGDTRYKAVQTFCAMLAEIRSLGEGIIISDQSPQKLARDAMRNTNLQLAHQLRDGDDRDAIARAMIMDEQQRDFIGKLDRGAAALFHTGLEKATFIQVAPYAAGPRDRGYGLQVDFPDDKVREYMERVSGTPLPEVPRPLEGCESCARPCELRDGVFPSVDRPEVALRLYEWGALTDRDEQKRRGLAFEDVWNLYLRAASEDLRGAGVEPDPDALWCHFVHGWRVVAEARGMSAAARRLTPRHRKLLDAAHARTSRPKSGSLDH
jgi:hypothetical protein